jgi:tetratricopeptide (TPR) repeat protein
MNKPGWIVTGAALAFALGAPAFSQMVGQVGNNPGQSPSDARALDQKFDELRNQGALKTVDAGKELEIGSNLVKQSKFAEAIPHLELALSKKPADVTTLIYLGFSHRMLAGTMVGFARRDELMKALEYYRRGLEADPKNRLLHEYTGKALVLLDDAPAAQGELKALQQLCPSGCDELKALSSVVPSATPAH